MAPKKDTSGDAAPAAPTSYRLTKAQTEKALAAAQEGPGGVVYGNLANKIGAYARAGDHTAAIEFTDAEVAMLGEWGVNIHEV